MYYFDIIDLLKGGKVLTTTEIINAIRDKEGYCSPVRVRSLLYKMWSKGVLDRVMVKEKYGRVHKYALSQEFIDSNLETDSIKNE